MTSNSDGTACMYETKAFTVSPPHSFFCVGKDETHVLMFMDVM